MGGREGSEATDTGTQKGMPNPLPRLCNPPIVRHHCLHHRRRRDLADAPIFLYLCFCFLAAGTIKGAVGMGLPTTSIALMTLTFDPRRAIALLLIPMLVTNAWQVYRMGDISGAFRRYLPFILTLVIGVWLSVTLSVNAPDRLLFGLLGVALLFFVLVTATKLAIAIPDQHDRPAQIGFGAVAGMIGGVTSVWAPPMAIYLASRRVAKDEFVRASGLLIFLGGLPLIAGYFRNGIMTRETATLSAIMLLPAMAGFALGERARRHMSEDVFRKLLLVVFFFMGLNLLRRAMF